MQSDKIMLFQPVMASWHELCDLRVKPIVHINHADPILKKLYGYSINFTKNRIIEVILIVTTIFSSLYSFITYPVRWYQNIKYTEFAIDNDLSRLSPKEQVEAEGMVRNYFAKHPSAFEGMSKTEKNKLLRLIISQCARSERVYGPVVREWVDHLLEKANQTNTKLVFMARDGIPFYQVARRLMQREDYRGRFPNLAKEGAIVLGYFSRNVVKSAEGSNEGKALFTRYIEEELRIQKGERCYFCDIGFSGSMVKPIRDLIPGVQIDFKFLVATSDRAEGHLGNPAHPLPHLETAANNLGVRWVEESHHGNIASATKLVVDDEGHVKPDTLCPKTRFDAKFSQAYLIRKFCLRRLVNAAVELGTLSHGEAVKAKECFSQTIGAIKANQLPVFVGWDY